MFPLTIATANQTVDLAGLISLGGLAQAVRPVQAGMLAEPRQVIIAGLHYHQMWTRDAAVNAWNSGSFLVPQAAGDGLLAVLGRKDGRYVLPHPDYYDAVVWVTGAWAHAAATRDLAFATTAYAAGCDLMSAWERDEFDAEFGLFRGGSFFNDGVSAYPGRYATSTGADAWGNVRHVCTSAKRHPVGGGLPMHCLSTNCLYLLGYQSLIRLAGAVGAPPDPTWAAKAEALRQRIRGHFWDGERGHLRYLVDRVGVDDRQEIGGWGFAVLAGVLDDGEVGRLAMGIERVPHGIPCLWPTYERYAQRGGVGRHSGLVWPQVMAFWGEACAKRGDGVELGRVLVDLARAYVRIGNCTECWDPMTGEASGGLQECEDRIQPYPYGICHNTTWGATGYLRLLLRGVAGMDDRWDGLALRPCLPPGLGPVRLGRIPWRGLVIDLTLRGAGARIQRATVDGTAKDTLWFAGSETGRRVVEVDLG